MRLENEADVTRLGELFGNHSLFVVQLKPQLTKSILPFGFPPVSIFFFPRYLKDNQRLYLVF